VLQKGAHFPIATSCFHTYLELPYYKPVPSEVKSNINRYFFKGLKKKLEDLAYIASLEEQNGLLHVNFYLLSNIKPDPDYILNRWDDALITKADIDCFQTNEASVKPIIDREKMLKYMIKYNRKDPQNYLPQQGKYKKLIYTSRNWKSYIEDHTLDGVLDDLFPLV